MKERHQMRLSTVLTVEALHSVYHFDLSDRTAKGELHDFYELVYVESGYYYVILDGERHTVPPGSVIFFAPNTFHTGDGTTQVTATVDILSFDAPSAAMHFFDNRTFPLGEAAREEFFLLFGAAQRCAEKDEQGGIRVGAGVSAADLQRLKSRFELFLLSLYDEGAPMPAPSNRRVYRKAQFRRVSDYLKENLARPLTVSEIAAASSLSVTGLKELCREFCACGPIDYLITLRILAAKDLIRGSGMNFSEIAEKTGFSSLHYFSRVFKARTGMSPTEYARMP